MKIELQWSRPIPLRSGSQENLIYTIHDLDTIPDAPGIYVFGRIGGRDRADRIPLYVGKAQRLRRRIKGQLNNTRLMLGLKNQPRQMRFVATAEYLGSPGPRAYRAIVIAERALIEYALASGYELLNQQGTRRPHHRIASFGSRAGRRWLPRDMSTPK